ncbi:MAG TPA: dihydrolipoamide acetyltransferase family protein [Feifaniaceae bacterium]|nr:dihydrolipoamide acetyltransferase family protein [Feifaniaceae bacterium]
MAFEVIMPKNGMDMKEGVLVNWLKNVGDRVEKDEPLIEIETDKITMEEPSAYSGVLLAQLVPPGTTVPVLQTIGYIGEPGEKLPEPSASPAHSVTPSAAPAAKVEAPAQAAAAPGLSGEGIPATPYAKKLASDNGIPLSDVPPSGKHGEVVGADVEKVLATPLAKRIAADRGIDLATVSGTGVGGKITKEDVLRAGITEAAGDDTVIKMTGMRRAVARNMAEASLVPAVTESTEADVTGLLELRASLNENREEKISINDFVLKAVAKALSKHKSLLVSMGEGDTIIQHHHVNLGMAVALDDGLIVPVIMDADQLGLEALALKAKDLAARARSGRLQQNEYAGSTFTVSNVGMYGITSFTPIINLPNAAILGVCGIKDELTLKNGQVAVAKKMGLSLTFDHRLIDGVPPAQFLVTLRRLLENPVDAIL